MTLLSSGLIVGQGAAALTSGQLAAVHGEAASFGLACGAAFAGVATACAVIRPHRFERSGAWGG